MKDFKIYEKYCQNKPRSESLWRQCSDSAFFQVFFNVLATILFSQLLPCEGKVIVRLLFFVGVSTKTWSQVEFGFLFTKACSKNNQISTVAKGRNSAKSLIDWLIDWSQVGRETGNLLESRGNAGSHICGTLFGDYLCLITYLKKEFVQWLEICNMVYSCP